MIKEIVISNLEGWVHSNHTIVITIGIGMDFRNIEEAYKAWSTRVPTGASKTFQKDSETIKNHIENTYPEYFI